MNCQWLFIILTPFQYRMMRAVFGSELESGKAHIFYGPAVRIDRSSGKEDLHPILFNNFSFSDIKRYPATKIPEYRRLISEMRSHWKAFLGKLPPRQELQVVIGSDKDNFTQILLNLLEDGALAQYRLHAVEEGLGYYVKENPADRIQAIMYRLFTPALFGEHLLYHKQLGTDSRIQSRYVRLPEMIPKYRGKTLPNLIRIGAEPRLQTKEVSKGKVLIYSFPEADFKMDHSAKGALLKALIKKLGNREIHVKPHPRETTDIFNDFPGLYLIEQESAGETIDYFLYEQIVNFTSSIIIDILDKGYPASRIVTVEMRKTGLSFFEGTQVVTRNKLRNPKFEIKSQL